MTDIATLSGNERDPSKIAFVVRQLAERAASALPFTDGDKGDITVSASGATWTVDDNAVTNAKIADMAQATIKGRSAGSGTGDPEDLTAAQVNAIIGVWNTFSPTITTSVGAITTLGTVVGRWQQVGGTIEVFLSINITTNGTGAGDVRCTNLPVTIGQQAVGCGREIAINGHMLSVTGPPAGTVATIQKYDNSYPGVDGAQLRVRFSYEV